MAKKRKPRIVIIAGPNGAGKSTVAPVLLMKGMRIREFVNADTIARGLNAFEPESVALSAGKIMLQHLKSLAGKRKSFAFETTLASRHFARWISELKSSSGYELHLFFMALPRVENAIARVKDRVRAGGHAIPEDVIRRRFQSGLHNLFSLYIPIADTWEILDNSTTEPRTVAFGAAYESAVCDADFFAKLQEMAR